MTGAEVVPEGVGYLPVWSERITVSGPLAGPVTSHAYGICISGRRLRASVRIIDQDGRTVVDIRGLECQTLHPTEGSEFFNLADTLYRYTWARKPLPGGYRTGDAPCQPAGTVLASEPSLQNLAREASAGLPSPLPASAGDCLDAIARCAIEEALSALPRCQKGPTTVDAAARGLGVPVSGIPAFEGVFRIAERLGLAVRREGGWRLSRRRGAARAAVAAREALRLHPGLLGEVTALARLARHLLPLLRQTIDAPAALCSAGADATIDHLAQDSPAIRPINLASRALLDRVLAGRAVNRPARVLECAGPGAGIVRWSLPAEGHGTLDCVFATLPSTFGSGSDPDSWPWTQVTRRSIDLESGLSAQGLADSSFDLVVVSQALAAVDDPRAVVERLARLLAGGGVLLLTGYQRPRPWRELLALFVSGPGCSPARRRSGDGDRLAQGLAALLPPDLVADVGAVSFGVAGGERAEVVAARRRAVSETVSVTPEGEGDPGRDRPRGTWIVLDPRGIGGLAVASQLERRIERAVVVTNGPAFRRLGENRFEVDPTSTADLDTLLADAASSPLRAVLCLSGLGVDGAAGDPAGSPMEAVQETCSAILSFVRALMRRADAPLPRLYIALSGSQQAPGDDGVRSPSQSAIWGLGRVIANEFPQSRCTLVDLDPADPEKVGAGSLSALVDEAWADDEEDEVAFRGGVRFVHRLSRLAPSRWAPARPAGAGATRFRLSIGRSATIEALGLVEVPRQAPGPGEVEIRVEAAGLNFSDVLKAVGLYPGLGDGPVPLGLECAGVVTRVGPGVAGLRLGDRVLAPVAFSFASTVTAPAEVVIPLPSRLGFPEGATIPVAFLTAYYGLVHLARLSRGERVLIHSASGGVGLAAIQIARDVGAEVFATAGSAERRAWLRDLGVGTVMDSRSLAFASEVRERTGGAGVDVVLNSLAGDAIRRGIETLGSYGRFVEIGKRDIYADRRLGLLPFCRNLSFFAVDLDMKMRERPALVGRLMREIGARLERGRYGPLPFRAVPIDGIREAFGSMAKARHLGKVVVTTTDHAPRVRAGTAPAPAIRPDRTYLVTGGLGGLGSCIAEWLADRGARHLVLAGRRGAASEGAHALVARLQARGVAVKAAACDVSREGDLRALFAELGASMPPLAGIVHAAGVLEDALITYIDEARLRRVMAPKVVGGWLLHRLSEALPLDFFVLCSSVSSVIGMPGQANYVAANAFLDGLASWRRARGLPAIAINWGFLGEVGMAARSPETVARFVNQGLRPISPDEAMELLAWFLGANPPQMTTVRMDWERFGEVFRTWARSPKFLPLYEDAGEGSRRGGSGAGHGPEQGRSLDALSTEERAVRVGELIAGRVARVLGADPATLDRERALTEMGLDSLMAVELRNWMESALRVSIPALEVMRGPTVIQLTGVVLDRMRSVTAPGGADESARGSAAGVGAGSPRQPDGGVR